MKNIVLILILGAFTLWLSSCEKIIMHPKPDADNLSVFNEYAKICTEKFGLTEIKGIDIPLLADSIRPYINDNLSQEELFNYMAIIATRLHEGHSSLEVPDLNLYAGYTHYEGYPYAAGTNTYLNYYSSTANPDSKYIGTALYETQRIQYGRYMQDEDIGFIRLTTFEVEATNEEIEAMLQDLSDTKGLVIDVRINLGGYVVLASQLASFFTTHEIEFGTNYIKNGPGPDDFAGSKLKLEPSNSPFTYTKPIILLQDRITFSAASLFTIMMYSMDHVTTLGQIFGGGTGEIIDGYLSNGWKYNLSTSNLVDKFGRPTDNGVEPDIPLLFTPADTINDPLIDRAILELQ